MKPPLGGPDRVYRSGAYSSSAKYAHVAYRNALDPPLRGSSLSFRLVRRSS